MNNIHRSAVITGASSGIGRACVLKMSKAGWQVFATVRKPQDRDKLQAENIPGLVPVLMDVEDRPSIMAAAEQISSQGGGSGLDGLVNVAGIGMFGPIEYATPRDVQKMFDVNLFGQIAVTQALLPLLRRKHGRIVNISSVGAHIAIPFGALLNASKAAFVILSDNLRLELHPFGLRVSTIEPGSITTPAVEKTLGDVERVIASLPAQGQAEYGEMLRAATRRGYKREMNGSSPDVVARAVHHALTAARPRIRYRVGKDAKLIGTLPRIMPDRLLDAIRLRALGLPAQFGALEKQGGEKRTRQVTQRRVRAV
jgi:NAD(P)-dependent dehydrogenase (short-subunit alcohol dehydrogenase family)